jgi:gamma-polyglutamate biosynthesis protein CapA
MTREYVAGGLIFAICGLFAFQNMQLLELVFPQPIIGSIDSINHSPNSETPLPLPGTGSTTTLSVQSSILFVGDIMLARDVETRLDKEGSDYAYRRSEFLKAESTYIVGNFEAAILKKHKHTKDFTFAFSVAPVHLLALREAGFTHLSLANNHTVDFGKEGYLHTKQVLETIPFTTFGDPYRASSSSVALVEVASTSVAIIGLQTVFTSSKLSDYLLLVSEVATTTDFQVVYIHWGDEYALRPSVTQQAFAKQLVAAGVDLIIGHHPHVTQSIEKIDSSIVAYSLGNFIFDQYFSSDVQEGLAISLSFKDGVPTLDLLPISSLGYRAQPGLMNRTSAATFLANLAARSSPSIAAMINSGTILYESALASSTEIAIMD